MFRVVGFGRPVVGRAQEAVWRRRRFWVMGCLLILALGAAGGVFISLDDHAGFGDGDSAAVPSRSGHGQSVASSSAAVSSAASPSRKPRLEGVSLKAVSAALSARWAIKPEVDSRGLVLMKPKRPAGGDMIIDLRPIAIGSDELSAIVCTVAQPNFKVTQAVIDDLGTCLVPLNVGGERDAILSWVREQGMTLAVPGFGTRAFSTLRIRAMHQSADRFAMEIAPLNAPERLGRR